MSEVLPPTSKKKKGVKFCTGAVHRLAALPLRCAEHAEAWLPTTTTVLQFCTSTTRTAYCCFTRTRITFQHDYDIKTLCGMIQYFSYCGLSAKAAKALLHPQIPSYSRGFEAHATCALGAAVKSFDVRIETPTLLRVRLRCMC